MDRINFGAAWSFKLDLSPAGPTSQPPVPLSSTTGAFRRRARQRRLRQVGCLPSRTLSQACPRMKPELSPAAIVFFSPLRRAELHPPYFSSRRGNTSELPLQPLFLPEFWPPPSLTFSSNLSCRWMHPRRSERRRTAAAAAAASAAVARCASIASAAQWAPRPPFSAKWSRHCPLVLVVPLAGDLAAWRASTAGPPWSAGRAEEETPPSSGRDWPDSRAGHTAHARPASRPKSTQWPEIYFSFIFDFF
jgi:hypothetical protein